MRRCARLPTQDGGGTIFRKELGELLQTLGIRASSEEVDRMFAEVDADKSGEIEFAEFLAVMTRRPTVPHTAADVKAAFRVFETEGCPPGYIRVSDLVQALVMYGGSGAAGSGSGSGSGAGSGAPSAVGASTRRGGVGSTVRSGVTTPGRDRSTAAGIAAGAPAEALTDSRIAELVAQLEPDAAGLVSYVDFVDMMMDG